MNVLQKRMVFMMEEIVPIGDGLCVIADISQKIARFEKMGKMKHKTDDTASLELSTSFGSYSLSASSSAVSGALRGGI